MPVNLMIPLAAELFPVPGLGIGVAEAGIRKPNRKDLTVVLMAEGSIVDGAFTQNRFCAATVQLCREHLAGAVPIRALLINTGNANAGTGEEGVIRARRTCAALAEKLKLPEQAILPFSTGVIMESLPCDRIITGLDAAIADAKPDNWLRAAQGIMTTDTVPKAFSTQIKLGDVLVVVTGISKGAGMIRPNMATMLGFIATDACVAPALMRGLAFDIAEQSFNRVTVDGDTSTNDSFVVVATNQARHDVLTSWDSPDGQRLYDAMSDIAKKLAQAIVRDGEGATKFIEIEVAGGRTTAECRQVAYAIAHSPLVKTAFFASDPNLGRILAAVGYAGLSDLDPTRIDLFLDKVHVVSQGGRHSQYLESDGQRVMKQSEIKVRVQLGRGDASDTIWTCDLSHDYVSINADYRS